MKNILDLVSNVKKLVKERAASTIIEESVLDLLSTIEFIFGKEESLMKQILDKKNLKARAMKLDRFADDLHDLVSENTEMSAELENRDKELSELKESLKDFQCSVCGSVTYRDEASQPNEQIIKYLDDLANSQLDVRTRTILTKAISDIKSGKL